MHPSPQAATILVILAMLLNVASFSLVPPLPHLLSTTTRLLSRRSRPAPPTSFENFDYSVHPKKAFATPTSYNPPTLIPAHEILKAIELLTPLISDERLATFDTVRKNRCWEVTFLFENPANPSNVFACLRTLDSFGIQSATILTPNADDAKHRETWGKLSHLSQNNNMAKPHSKTVLNSMRVAAGSARWLDVDFCDKQVAACVGAFKRDGWRILVSAVDGKARDVREVDWPGKVGEEEGGRNKVCIVMGNEDQGVSPEMLALADETFYLPMVGFAESYNLSVATSLTCGYMSSEGVLVPSCKKGGKYKKLVQPREEEVMLKWMMASLTKHDMAEKIFRKNGLTILDEP